MHQNIQLFPETTFGLSMRFDRLWEFVVQALPETRTKRSRWCSSATESSNEMASQFTLVKGQKSSNENDGTVQRSSSFLGCYYSSNCFFLLPVVLMEFPMIFLLKLWSIGIWIPRWYGINPPSGWPAGHEWVLDSPELMLIDWRLSVLNIIAFRNFQFFWVPSSNISIHFHPLPSILFHFHPIIFQSFGESKHHRPMATSPSALWGARHHVRPNKPCNLVEDGQRLDDLSPRPVRVASNGKGRKVVYAYKCQQQYSTIIPLCIVYFDSEVLFVYRLIVFVCSSIYSLVYLAL